MKGIWAASLILLIFTACSRENEGPCIVTRIIDGSTFHCTADGEDLTVRLIGVDTPALPSLEGEEAKAFVKGRLPAGSVVRLEMDVQLKDSGQRTLAYVWLPDGSMLNETLLRNGYAEPAPSPPNVKYKARLDPRK